MGWSGYSYTAATGKRPDWIGGEATWYDASDPVAQMRDEDDGPSYLPESVFFRLAGGSEGVGWWTYPTEFAALAAADDAFRRAVADGAMPPPS